MAQDDKKAWQDVIFTTDDGISFVLQRLDAMAQKDSQRGTGRLPLEERESMWRLVFYLSCTGRRLVCVMEEPEDKQDAVYNIKALRLAYVVALTMLLQVLVKVHEEMTDEMHERLNVVTGLLEKCVATLSMPVSIKVQDARWN